MNNNTVAAKSLVEEILNQPSKISECYTLFHDYSILNALAIRFQCQRKGLEVGPTASFKKWQERGVKIKKGQKALAVCIPFTVKSKYLTRKVKQNDGTETTEPVTYTAFTWKNCVFTYAQTDGKPFKQEEKQTRLFSYERACKALGIEIIPFDMVNGNVQGFSSEKGIAINPMAQHATRTAIHEIAHNLLHKNSNADKSLKEVEAELTSYILGLILKLDGVEESRGYIKHWLGSNELQEKTALKCICLANKIYTAGR